MLRLYNSLNRPAPLDEVGVLKNCLSPLSFIRQDDAEPVNLAKTIS